MRKVRLNSFPMIAGASLLIALLLGFGLGSLRDTPGALPTMPVTPDFEAPDYDNGRESPDVDRAPERDAVSGRRDSSDDDPGRTTITETEARNDGDHNSNSSRTTDNMPDTTAEGLTRTLKEGRTDPVVEGVQPDEPTGSIEVMISDTRGNRLPSGQLAVDVKSGPLGWHSVPAQPRALSGERGVFVFSGLYPGQYRVRSTATNYQEAEETVRITQNGQKQSVALTLLGLEVAEVEFYVKLPDGTIPDQVGVGIKKGRDANYSTKGRFSDYDPDVTTHSRGGVISATRYRLGPDASGVIKLRLGTGIVTYVTFSVDRDGEFFKGETSVTPPPGLSRENVTLKASDREYDARDVEGSVRPARLILTLTVDGEAPEFTRVNLRKQFTDFQYHNATTSEGNRFTWDVVISGHWFLVAESEAYHAPFVQEITVGEQENQSIDIQTTPLRVIAKREPGSPDPEGEMRYRVRLRPRGSGTIERAYNGDLTGKDEDQIDFTVPVGDYDVRVESPENYAKLSAVPVEQNVTMTLGVDAELEYTLAAGSSLRFLAVDKLGQPIPNVEYLISFSPAGEAPESEQSNVKKGAYDGVCETDEAPAGPVYVHIWTASNDWNNPDHVFQLNLPAYETKDLGAVIVGQ